MNNVDLNTNRDYDIGHAPGSSGYLTFNGGCFDIASDFIIGHWSGGEGTMYMDNGSVSNVNNIDGDFYFNQWQGGTPARA